MDIAERILVAVLAGVLTIFLVLGIIAVAKIIQILNQLKRITDKAEKLADKAEAIGDFFDRARGPVNFIKLVGNVIEGVAKHAHNKKSKEE